MQTYTFEQFQATRTALDVDAFAEATSNIYDEPLTGYQYAAGLYIAIPTSLFDGDAPRYWLQISNCVDEESSDLAALERKLYDYGIDSQEFKAPFVAPDMQVAYISDEADPCVMPLQELLDNFEASDAYKGMRFVGPQDIVDEVCDGRGWFDGIHDNGAFLILNIAKAGLCPTPEAYDRMQAQGGAA
jgi:hypothetical protein